MIPTNENAAASAPERDHEPLPYTPSEQELKLVRLVDDRFASGLEVRRAHEGQWFVNGAFFRGHQYVEWNGRDARLQVPPMPRHRVRLVINRIQPKVRARIAKFLKNRPVPVVAPATPDIEDKLNARATTRFFEFIWQKLHLERKYSQALRWAAISDHGYWWFYWDPEASGKIVNTNPELGPTGPVVKPIGEICVEVGSPFEVVVADPTLDYIGDQPWIIRTKRRPLSYIKARYPEKAPFVAPDHDGSGGENSGERYARQLSTLNSQALGNGATFITGGKSAPTHQGRDDEEPWVLVKELFERPCAEYPQGRHLVVAGGVVLREAHALPYFADYKENPYPCVDFVDFQQVGQYWGTTIIEQLIQPQREYNLIRSKLAEHQRLMAHPKLITFKEHNLAPGVWTQEAGEVIVAAWRPQMPLPQPWHPPPISVDVWKGFDLLKGEIEDISQIFPVSEGKTGGSSSGFQTNLLQEATDAVHGPDIRGHELAMEEAFWKIRRLAKIFYAPARLITVMGRDAVVEANEFHRDDIDEAADIRIQTGSALPTLKAARMQSVMEMWSAGLLGLPDDPQARQRALTMMELGTTEDIYESSRVHEEAARLENLAFAEGRPAPNPEFFHNHDIHFRVHSEDLMSPAAQQRPPQVRLAQIAHVIRHVAFVNPQAAWEYAMQYGLQEQFADVAFKLQQLAAAAQPGSEAPQGPPTQEPPQGVAA